MLSLITSTISFSQSINVISGATQFAAARGSLQVDSMFVIPYRDTIYTFSVYPAMRVPARLVFKPQDKRPYFYNGTRWYSPLDRSFHFGTQSVSTITGLSTVATTGSYWDLIGLPNMSMYITYSDTIPGSIMTTFSANSLYKAINYTPSFLEITTALGYTPSNPNGTNLQYIAGDGTKITFPTVGEINTASNVGSGSGVFKQKSSLDFQFKTILGTSNQIIVTANTNDLTLSLPNRTETSPARSLVTTTASTGFQPNANIDMNVIYSIYVQVTSALIGTNTADVFLEIAATNSTTPTDWTTKSRSGISLAGLVSTSGNTQTVSCFVPKGYYVRLRVLATGGNSGATVFTFQTSQENTY